MLTQSTEPTAPVSTTLATNDAQALAPGLPAGVADLDQAREQRRTTPKVSPRFDPNDPILPPATPDDWWEFLRLAPRDPELRDHQARVLWALMSYANGPQHGRPLEDARPGVELLAEATGKSEATVGRILGELRALGYIRRYQRGGTHGNNASIYRLTVPAARITAAQARAEARAEVRRAKRESHPGQWAPVQGQPEQLAEDRALTGEGPGPSRVRGLGPHGWGPTFSMTFSGPHKMPNGSAGSAARAVENSEQSPAEPAAEAPKPSAPEPVAEPMTGPEQPAPSTSTGRTQPKGRPTPKQEKRQRHDYAADFSAWWDAYRTASDRPVGSKPAAARAYALARRTATAEDMLGRVADYAAGHARQRSAQGWAPNFPDAVRWIRDERWEDYATAPTDGPSDAATDAAATAARDKAIEAVMGPYSPPDLPADLSPEDYRAAVLADKTDWRTASGRWERSTAAA